MSLYKTAKSPYYQYDFVIKGHRFHGSTGQETKRAAEAFERRLRIDAAEGKLGAISQLTIDQAAGKWWVEVGIQRGDRDDVERRLERLLDLLGRQTKLSDIDTAVVSKAVERRRGRLYVRSPAKAARTYAPSNATVNRDVIQSLRPILSRASDVWGARGLPTINWKGLRLSEPRETVRVYSETEQEAWLEACGPEARLPLELMLKYGLRFGELFFHIDAFEADGPRLNLSKGRKRDVPHSLPLLVDHGRALAARISRARAAGLETTWFVEEPAGGCVRLRALSYYGLESRISRAADKAGIKGVRRIHGARHHAGTDILRKTGNLKLAQRLLGHADIKSTMRYVHAMEEDLRAGLEGDLSRNSPGRKSAAAKKDRKIKGMP